MKQFSQYQRASSSSGEAVRLFGPQRDAVTYASQQARTLPERLDSWKEIASYLGREVRTAQRWEKQECLPVHRHFHQKTSSVYGFKTEIDEWRDNRSRRSDPRTLRRGAGPILKRLVASGLKDSDFKDGSLAMGRCSAQKPDRVTPQPADVSAVTPLTIGPFGISSSKQHVACNDRVMSPKAEGNGLG